MAAQAVDRESARRAAAGQGRAAPRLTPLRVRLGILLGSVAALAVVVPTVLHALVLNTYLEREVSRDSVELARIVGALSERRIEQVVRGIELLMADPSFPVEVRTRDVARMSERLALAVPIDEDISSMLIRDRDGIAWASSLRSSILLGQPLLPNTGLQGAFTTRAPTVGLGAVGPTSGRPIVPVAVPVRDDTGEFAGIVVAALRLDRLAQHLEGLRSSSQGFVSLYDRSGARLIGPDRAAVLQPGAGTDEAVKAALRGEVAQLQTTGADGAANLAVALPIAHGWVVEVQEPMSSVRAPLYFLVAQDALIGLGVFVLLTAVGIVIGKRKTEPFTVLLNEMRSVRRGAARSPLPRSSTAELAWLADEFEAMCGALEARTAELRAALDTLDRYRLLAERTNDIVVFLGPDRTIVDLNAAAERAYGLTRAELIGRSGLDLAATPQDRLAQEQWERAYREGLQFETNHRRSDGSIFPIEISVVGAPSDAAGSPPLWLSLGRDLSARRASQAALRASEARYRSVVESIQEVVFQCDADGRFTLLNPAWTAVTGYAVEEALGRHLLDFVHTSDRHRLRHVFGAADGSSAIPRRAEVRILTRSGTARWLDTYVVPALDGAGRAQRISGTAMDVTERRLSEAARTRMLVREQLVRAREERAAEVTGIVQHMPCGVLVFDNDGCVTLANELALEMLSPSPAGPSRASTGGAILHPTELLDPRLLAPCRSLVTRALSGSVVSEAELRRVQTGDEGPVLVGSAAPLRSAEGAVRGAVVVLTDVTHERRLMNDLMLSEGSLRHSLESLIVLHESGRALSSTLVEEEIGRRLVESCIRIARLDAALVFVPDRGAGVAGRRVLGEAGDPFLISHVLNCPASQADRDDALAEVLGSEIRPTHPCPEMLVGRGYHLQLVARGRVIGVLEFYGADQLSAVTRDALSSLAAHAVSALENAHLYREVADREQRLQDALRRLLIAQEEERRRVAYELHDGLAQVAAATHLCLQTFASQYRPRSEHMRQQLDRSVELARRVVRESRQVIAGLRPTVLDDFGLEQALRIHFQELTAEGGAVEYQSDLGPERLPGPIETVLYRIAQEALTNVRKHAQSLSVNVRVTHAAGYVEMEIVDRGVGFRLPIAQAGVSPGEQVGLVGMRERAALVGGECVVWSEPGHGTRVTVRVPLSTAAKMTSVGARANGR